MASGFEVPQALFLECAFAFGIVKFQYHHVSLVLLPVHLSQLLANTRRAVNRSLDRIHRGVSRASKPLHSGSGISSCQS
jgi:hypothetical protein